jgi:hypothetical protein
MRQTGYAISIGVNLVLLWIITNIVEWDIIPFLTADFEELVPVAVFSIIVGSMLYLAYLFFDPPWFRILGDAINSAIAFVVILRTLQVFPFAFEGGFWTGATRVILIFLAVATGIATLANLGKLLAGKTSERDLTNRPA